MSDIPEIPDNGGLLESLLIICRTMEETLSRERDIIDRLQKRVATLEQRLNELDNSNATNSTG